MRRVCNWTHHHISPKHLHLYVAEAAKRLNIKDMLALDRMEAVRNMVDETLTYKHPIAKNTSCGVQ